MARGPNKKLTLLVGGYAVVAGGWIYAAIQIGDRLEGGWVAFVALTILMGIFVRRWWVALGVIGPIIGFAALEATSDFGRGDWIDLPVLSPPALFFAVLIAMGLLLGCAIGEGVDWALSLYRERPRH